MIPLTPIEAASSLSRMKILRAVAAVAVSVAVMAGVSGASASQPPGGVIVPDREIYVPAYFTNFGTMAPGETKDVTLSVVLNPDFTAYDAQLAAVGAEDYFSWDTAAQKPKFAMAGTTCPVYGAKQTLTPGRTCTVTIRYTARGSGGVGLPDEAYQYLDLNYHQSAGEPDTVGSYKDVYVRFQIVANVNCAGRTPTIWGTSGNDTIQGTPGDDVIAGLHGTDTISGGGGSDVICGGTQQDAALPEGYVENDLILGGPGSDRLAGGPGDDLLKGGAGRDVCRGKLGDDAARRCERTASL